MAHFSKICINRVLSELYDDKIHIDKPSRRLVSFIVYNKYITL